VVEFDAQDRSLADNPVGMRYRHLFGDNLDWHNKGIEGYIQSLA
jgi:hypothetical protein